MNALEMVIVEVVKLILFSLVWYAIARFFYPHYSKKVALDIMDDDEYVRKTQQIQEKWMHAMVKDETTRILDLIMARVDTIAFDSDHIIKQIEKIDIHPDQILEQMREWFPSWFNGWYGSLIKKDNAVQKEQDGATQDIVSYATANKGNPDAMDQIKKWAIARNPNLGALITIAEMFKNNGNSRSPPNQGSGGY